MWLISRPAASSSIGQRISYFQSCLSNLFGSIKVWPPAPNAVSIHTGLLQIPSCKSQCAPVDLQHRFSRSLWLFSQLWDAPKARVSMENRKAHGREWTDGYGWMDQSDKSEELVDYLREETAYSLDKVAKTRLVNGLRKKYDKDAKILKKDFVEVNGGFEYWASTTSGTEVLKRRQINSKKVETLLNADDLYREMGVTGVGGSKVSPCHKYIAFLGEHDRGSESYILYVKDLEKDSILPNDSAVNVVRMEWSSDSTKLIYTIQNEKGRPWKVMVRPLEGHQGQDLIVFEEMDDQYIVHVESTRDHAFIALTTASKTSSEVYMLDGKLASIDDMHCVQPRQPGVQYFVEHHKGWLYILTNATASGNYDLKRAYLSSMPNLLWETLLEDTRDFSIEDMKMFDEKCILLGHCCGRHDLRVLDMKQLEAGEIQMSKVPVPEWCSHIELGDIADFKSDSFRFEASSPVHPPCVLEYDLKKGEINKFAPAGSDEMSGSLPLDDKFRLTSHVVKSHDGVEVPMTLVHDKSIQRDSSNPVLVLVYGAYGQALSLDYQSHRLPLLRQGWVVAYAHVRGGGELGPYWHRQGQLRSKLNSMEDCVACIHYLINQGYTRKGGVAVEAHSAGGLIAAHIVNRFPDFLFGALLQMPFVDLWTCMSNPDLPLTTLEYEEWGDPRKPDQAEMLYNLCPYQNIKAGISPPVFVTCALNDPRVPAWGPAKWVAKMRSMKSGGPVLLHADFLGGHWGNPEDSAYMSAAQYAFLLSHWTKASQQLPPLGQESKAN